MPNPKTRKYPRVLQAVGAESLTKQSFKDECNINKIMAKFQKTGAITHFTTYSEEYGDCTPIQLADAQNIIIKAESMFEELPSEIRKKFNNNPEEFLEFVQNPDNAEEMKQLGLRESQERRQGDLEPTQSNTPAPTPTPTTDPTDPT